jgi:hypothetical protein
VTWCDFGQLFRLPLSLSSQKALKFLEIPRNS